MHKILVISHLFPNDVENTSGIFVFDQVRFLSKLVDIKVVSPLIWFPFSKYSKKWGKYHKVNKKIYFDGIEIIYPRYFAISSQIPSVFLAYLAGFLYTLTVSFKIATNYKRFEFDIIHAHFAYPDGFAAVLIGKIINKPVVLTVHGSDVNIYLDKRKHLRNIILFSLRYSDHVIVVSQPLKSKLLELGISNDKISVINNGYDPNVFFPIDQSDSRKQLGLPISKKIILYVGRLQTIKGLNYLIESMKQVVEKHNNVLLILLGEGSMESELKNMVNKYNLSNYVTFVGSQKHEIIPLWMNACDFLILPSLSEGLPLVLVEASACGKPIIATDVGGVSEATDSSSRLLVPPENSRALSMAILKMLNSKYDSSDIIKKNQKFNYNRLVEDIFSLYDRILKS